MILKPLLILTIFILTFFHSKAVSVATNASTYRIPIDSASGTTLFDSNSSTENKSTSFFTKMKNKAVRSLAKFFFRKQHENGVKKAFGFVSISLVLLSVLALLWGSPIGLIIFGFAGILAGLISLFIRKDSTIKNSGNSLGLIGMILGVAIFAALVIAFFSSGVGH